MQNHSISTKAYFRYGRLLLVLCGLAWVSAVSAYEISVQADTNAAGSGDIISNVAYSIKDDECLIRWNAIQYKTDNKRELKAARQCDKSFAQQAEYHEDILKRINQDIPIASFSSLIWGGFTYNNDYSWVIPIALASDRSVVYQDYRDHFPYAKVNDVNKIFVEIANESHAYQPLADLLYAYDMTLTLDSVEKVSVSKAGKLPFYDDIKDKRIGKNANVIYDAGVCNFRMAPQKSQ